MPHIIGPEPYSGRQADVDLNSSTSSSVSGPLDNQNPAYSCVASPRLQGSARAKCVFYTSRSAERVARRSRPKLNPIRINLSQCKYEVLRLVQRALGWKEITTDNEGATPCHYTIPRFRCQPRLHQLNSVPRRVGPVLDGLCYRFGPHS